MNRRDREQKRIRRAELQAQGFSKVEAALIAKAEQIEKKTDERVIRAEIKADEDRNFPLYPERARSVRAISAGGFETNRRKH